MESKILFMGMYESGKTTFIACLWDYINSSRSDKLLTLLTLANTENEYLEKIRSEWLQFLKVTRTYMVNKTENVVMKSKITASDTLLSLQIPDISGELFNSHFQGRTWSQDYEEILTDITGIILFINPTDNKNRTHFIVDAQAIVDDIITCTTNQEGTTQTCDNKEVSSKGRESLNEKIEFINWSEEHTANQVKLVENLQFIEFRNLFSKITKVSVVVSCWDLIEKNGIKHDPEHWVEKHLPLLHQYITCNDKLFVCKYFGVSAQGCDYKDTDRVQELRLVEPYERPIVKEGENYTNDITRPIIWLTNDDTKN